MLRNDGDAGLKLQFGSVIDRGGKRRRSTVHQFTPRRRSGFGFTFASMSPNARPTGVIDRGDPNRGLYSYDDAAYGWRLMAARAMCSEPSLAVVTEWITAWRQLTPSFLTAAVAIATPWLADESFPYAACTPKAPPYLPSYHRTSPPVLALGAQLIASLPPLPLSTIVEHGFPFLLPPHAFAAAGISTDGTTAVPILTALAVAFPLAPRVALACDVAVALVDVVVRSGTANAVRSLHHAVRASTARTRPVTAVTATDVPRPSADGDAEGADAAGAADGDAMDAPTADGEGDMSPNGEDDPDDDDHVSVISGGSASGAVGADVDPFATRQRVQFACAGLSATTTASLDALRGSIVLIAASAPTYAPRMPALKEGARGAPAVLRALVVGSLGRGRHGLVVTSPVFAAFGSPRSPYPPQYAPGSPTAATGRPLTPPTPYSDGGGSSPSSSRPTTGAAPVTTRDMLINGVSLVAAAMANLLPSVEAPRSGSRISTAAAASRAVSRRGVSAAVAASPLSPRGPRGTSPHARGDEPDTHNVDAVDYGREALLACPLAAIVAANTPSAPACEVMRLATRYLTRAQLLTLRLRFDAVARGASRVADGVRVLRLADLYAVLSDDGDMFAIQEGAHSPTAAVVAGSDASPVVGDAQRPASPAHGYAHPRGAAADGRFVGEYVLPRCLFESESAIAHGGLTFDAVVRSLFPLIPDPLVLFYVADRLPRALARHLVREFRELTPQTHVDVLGYMLAPSSCALKFGLASGLPPGTMNPTTDTPAARSADYALFMGITKQNMSTQATALSCVDLLCGLFLSVPEAAVREAVLPLLRETAPPIPGGDTDVSRPGTAHAADEYYATLSVQHPPVEALRRILAAEQDPTGVLAAIVDLLPTRPLGWMDASVAHSVGVPAPEAILTAVRAMTYAPPRDVVGSIASMDVVATVGEALPVQRGGVWSDAGDVRALETIYDRALPLHLARYPMATRPHIAARTGRGLISGRFAIPLRSAPWTRSFETIMGTILRSLFPSAAPMGARVMDNDSEDDAPVDGDASGERRAAGPLIRTCRAAVGNYSRDVVLRIAEAFARLPQADATATASDSMVSPRLPSGLSSPWAASGSDLPSIAVATQPAWPPHTAAHYPSDPVWPPLPVFPEDPIARVAYCRGLLTHGRPPVAVMDTRRKVIAARVLNPSAAAAARDAREDAANAEVDDAAAPFAAVLGAASAQDADDDHDEVAALLDEAVDLAADDPPSLPSTVTDAIAARRVSGDIGARRVSGDVTGRRVSESAGRRVSDYGARPGSGDGGGGSPGGTMTSSGGAGRRALSSRGEPIMDSRIVLREALAAGCRVPLSPSAIAIVAGAPQQRLRVGLLGAYLEAPSAPPGAYGGADVALTKSALRTAAVRAVGGSVVRGVAGVKFAGADGGRGGPDSAPPPLLLCAPDVLVGVLPRLRHSTATAAVAATLPSTAALMAHKAALCVLGDLDRLRSVRGCSGVAIGVLDYLAAPHRSPLPSLLDEFVDTTAARAYGQPTTALLQWTLLLKEAAAARADMSPDDQAILSSLSGKAEYAPTLVASAADPPPSPTKMPPPRTRGSAAEPWLYVSLVELLLVLHPRVPARVVMDAAAALPSLVEHEEDESAAVEDDDNAALFAAYVRSLLAETAFEKAASFVAEEAAEWAFIQGDMTASAAVVAEQVIARQARWVRQWQCPVCARTIAGTSDLRAEHEAICTAKFVAHSQAVSVASARALRTQQRAAVMSISAALPPAASYGAGSLLHHSAAFDGGRARPALPAVPASHRPDSAARLRVPTPPPRAPASAPTASPARTALSGMALRSETARLMAPRVATRTTLSAMPAPPPADAADAAAALAAAITPPRLASASSSVHPVGEPAFYGAHGAASPSSSLSLTRAPTAPMAATSPATVLGASRYGRLLASPVAAQSPRAVGIATLVVSPSIPAAPYMAGGVLAVGHHGDTLRTAAVPAAARTHAPTCLWAVAPQRSPTSAMVSAYLPCTCGTR